MQIGESTRLEWRCFGDLSAEELYEVLRFRQAIFVVEQSSPYPDLDDLDQRAHHLLVRIDQALVGYARLVPRQDDIVIGRVGVAERRRGFGLAKLIMSEALARCRRDYGGRAVTLSAQAYLAKFYEDLGFRLISPPYDDYGVTHLDMRRDAAADERG